MPLDLGFLQRPINVKWGDTLAVEFTGLLSYLRLNQALSMNKVTISFWFRIPFEVANAKATADNSRPTWDFAVLDHCIPLIMFGQQQTGQTYEWDSDNIIGWLPSYSEALDGSGGVYYDPIPVYGTQVSGSRTAPMQPSGIGVQFGQGNPDGGLSVHIQTADFATAENIVSEAVGIELIEGRPTEYNTITRDASYTVTGAAEALGNVGNINMGVYGGNTAPAIMADQWHHILISWDLQTGNVTHGSEDGSTAAAGTDAYSLMWCAVDDVNKDKLNLPANWIGVSWSGPGDSGANPNAHLSNVAYKYAGMPGGTDPPRVNVSFTPIPSNPLIIPAPATLSGQTDTVNANQLVEMAELQIFTGIALDTSEPDNRRAFIDFKRDADGNPIADADGKYTMKPVDPKKAEELMGKKPEVLLHGTGKWIEGYNTGSIGVSVDEDGEPVKLPGGQFVPTGLIQKYEPDPSLTVDTSS